MVKPSLKLSTSIAMKNILIRVREVIALAPEVEEEVIVVLVEEIEVRVVLVEEKEGKNKMMTDQKAQEVLGMRDAVEKKGVEVVVEIMIVIVKTEAEVVTQWREEVGEGEEMKEMIEEAEVAMVEIEIEVAGEETMVVKKLIQHYSLAVLMVTNHKIKLEKSLVNSVKLEMSKYLKDSDLLSITNQTPHEKLKTNCMKQTYLELEEPLE